jgi:very-short-patch-repair endonuclease
MTRIEFLERARNIHGYKYNYLNLPNKVILNDKIEIEHKGQIYKQTISKHLMGRCPEKSIKKKTNKEFIAECKEIWGDKYDYSQTEYTGSLNNIKIIYNGIIYEQRASSHLLGFSPEFRNNEESLLINEVNKHDINGILEIKEFLERYNISFEMNKNINNLIFHFYIEKLRTIIEYIGEKHYLIIDFDKIKEDYCEENYINLIRIRYDQLDDIYKILWDNLKRYIKN